MLINFCLKFGFSHLNFVTLERCFCSKNRKHAPKPEKMMLQFFNIILFLFNIIFFIFAL